LILRDYSWGKNCDRTQHPRGITVKLEYQFTFKEYLEASRISTKLETFSEVEFWTRAVLILGGLIVYIIAGSNPLYGNNSSVLGKNTAELAGKILKLLIDVNIEVQKYLISHATQNQ
jgi:hypothetical protein